MVETPMRSSYGPHGFDLAPMAWRMPDEISDDDRISARENADLLADVLETESTDSLTKWLTALGSLMAGNMTEVEAAIKLRAYVSILDVPRCLLTKATLREAANRFKFFPTFGEVSAFFDEKRRPLETQLDRLRKIAGVKTTAELAMDEAMRRSARHDPS